MADLLLELFSEEIPARMQVRAVAYLKKLVTKALPKKHLWEYNKVARYFEKAESVIKVFSEHLKLLSIFHYVVGSIIAVFSCFPIIHIVFGLILIIAPEAVEPQGELPSAAQAATRALATS